MGDWFKAGTLNKEDIAELQSSMRKIKEQLDAKLQTSKSLESQSGSALKSSLRK